MSQSDASAPRPESLSQEGGEIQPEKTDLLLSDSSIRDALSLQSSPPFTGFRAWEPPTVEQLQASLPSYEVQQFLARGGMGAVYKARQKSLNRLVAIKILRPGVIDEELNFTERFRNEAETMAKLSHPAIVSVYDFGVTDGGQPYFVMEFIDGSDVARHLEMKGKLPVDEAVRIMRAVCEALDYAHRHGVIHRDIKPANVLIDSDDRIKVADFGLAKALHHSQDSGLTRSGITMGTQAFAAPEMSVPGAAVDLRSDLYSAGVMFYQMLTGDMPRVMFKLPSLRRPELGTRFDALICRALESDPADRFESAAQMKLAIESAARDDSSVRKSMPGGKNPPSSFRIMAAAAIIALAACAYFLFKKPSHIESRPNGNGGAAAVASNGPIPRAIRLWDAPDKTANQPGVRWEDGAARLDNGGWLRFTDTIARDASLRVEVRTNPDAKDANIALRWRKPPGTSGEEYYRISFQPEKNYLELHRVHDAKPYDRLGGWTLPRRYRSGEWLPLELKAVGNEITITADGTLLGSVRDASLMEAGGVMLYAKSNAYFRNIVFVPLDNRDAVSQTAGHEPRAVRLWNGPDKIKKSGGVSWEDGALRLDNAMQVTQPPYHADVVIRASVKMNPDAVSPSISLRGFQDDDGDGRYSATVMAAEKKINLQIFDSRPSSSQRRTILHEWPLPRAYATGEWARLELRAVGDELTVSLDGQVLGAVHNDVLTKPGMVQVYATRAGFFRDIVYVPLGNAPDMSAPAIDNWQDKTEEVREKARTISNLAVDPGLVRHIGSGDSVAMPLTRPGMRDYAVRLRFTSDGQIDLRASPAGFLYVLCQREKVLFHRYEAGESAPVVLHPNVPYPAGYDTTQPHELLVTMQGSTLRAWLDGRFIGDAQDTKLQEGPARILFTKSSTVNKVEVAELTASH